MKNLISAPPVQTCPATAYVPATVCTEVTVTPFANPLGTTTHCCGEPVVTPIDPEDPDPPTCDGVLNGTITFLMSQEICVEVPVAFGANTTVGDPVVDAGTPTDEDVCTNCDNGGTLG